MRLTRIAGAIHEQYICSALGNLKVFGWMFYLQPKSETKTKLSCGVMNETEGGDSGVQAT